MNISVNINDVPSDEDEIYEIMKVTNNTQVCDSSLGNSKLTERLITIFMHIKDNVFEALYDTGSTISLIHKDFIEDSKIKFEIELSDVLNSLSESFAGVGRVKFNFKIRNLEHQMDFYVIDSNTFRYDILLGLDAIKKFKLIQDENLNILQKI